MKNIKTKEEPHTSLTFNDVLACGIMNTTMFGWKSSKLKSLSWFIANELKREKLKATKRGQTLIEFVHKNRREKMANNSSQWARQNDIHQTLFTVLNTFLDFVFQPMWDGMRFLKSSLFHKEISSTLSPLGFWKYSWLIKYWLIDIL